MYIIKQLQEFIIRCKFILLTKFELVTKLFSIFNVTKEMS